MFKLEQCDKRPRSAVWGLQQALWGAVSQVSISGALRDRIDRVYWTNAAIFRWTDTCHESIKAIKI